MSCGGQPNIMITSTEALSGKAPSGEASAAFGILAIAARLLRDLIHWGTLSDEDAGRLTHDLSPEQWRALERDERQVNIQAGRQAMGGLCQHAFLPIERQGRGWIWAIPGKPIHCAKCGRLLGHATEDNALRIVIPTISRIEIAEGIIRCACGQERTWRSYNPNQSSALIVARR